MIADLRPGDQMDHDVLVNSYELKFSEKVKNNYFLSMLCKDSSGEISVKVFDLPKPKLDELTSLLDDSKFLHIQGNVEEYKGNKNVKAQNIEFIEDPIDMSYFEKCSPISLDILIERLDKAINDIEDQNLKLLVSNLIGENGKYREKFLVWPAAKSMHHAFRHGLVQHSLEVYNFIINDYNCYQKFDDNTKNQDINWDVLRTAALLHDIAKIEELDYNQGATNYTSIGDLVGHLCLGAMWVYNEIQNMKEFSSTTLELLMHVFLSHHGRLDWGSALEPKTIEAELFHQADNRSAMMNKSLKSKNPR